MWPKDNYQEQMLGYLGEVQTEIEQFAQARLHQHDLNVLYTDLDVTAERLWQLIGASNEEWERFRYSLETSCDELLRAFYRLPPAGTLMLSASVMRTEHHERQAELWETAEMLR